MTEQEKDALKRLIDHTLLNGPLSFVSNFFNDLISACKNQEIPFDLSTALEYWWLLARLGAVAVPGAKMGTLLGVFPQEFFLTDRGRKLLERGEQSPHDPPKYLAAVRRRVESPDEIAMTYLDEAVGAWAAMLYRSSAVMLGCACERLILLLAEEITSANLPPWSSKIQNMLKDPIFKVSKVFAVVRDCLMHMPSDKKLPGALDDALDRKLSPIFEHARGLRNKSGHPTGADVTSEEAEANLLLFPGFYGLVSDLCKHLRASNATGANA